MYEARVPWLSVAAATLIALALLGLPLIYLADQQPARSPGIEKSKVNPSTMLQEYQITSLASVPKGLAKAQSVSIGTIALVFLFALVALFIVVEVIKRQFSPQYNHEKAIEGMVQKCFRDAKAKFDLLLKSL